MVGRIIRKKDLHLFTGLRATAIDNEIMEGNFPKPIPIGKRAVGWREDEISQWQERQTAKRDDAKFTKERLKKVTPPGAKTMKG
jgi:prophage regulatory protein